MSAPIPIESTLGFSLDSTPRDQNGLESTTQETLQGASRFTMTALSNRGQQFRGLLIIIVVAPADCHDYNVLGRLWIA
jgi:hypothetical protein